MSPSRNALSAFVAIAALSVILNAQTVRSFALQNVFVTYVGNSNHWVPNVMDRGPQLVAQVNNYWHGPKGSWGAITYTDGGTKGWLDTTITTSTTCPSSAMISAVAAAYGAIPAGTVRHIVFPPGTPCNSQAFLGGNTLWTVGGAYVEHEIGHTLGLAHTGGVWPDGSRQLQAPYDLMGTQTYGDTIHVAYKQRLGLYSPTFQLVTATTAQDVVLQFADNMTPGIKGVIVPKVVSVTTQGPFGPVTTNVTHTMSAEFRGGDYLSTGVIIHGGPNDDILTTNPSQQNFWRMVVGQRFCDPITPSLICITLLAQDATTATVRVEPITPVLHKPSRPVSARVQ